MTNAGRIDDDDASDSEQEQHLSDDALGPEDGIFFLT